MGEGGLAGPAAKVANLCGGLPTVHSCRGAATSERMPAETCLKKLLGKVTKKL